MANYGELKTRIRLETNRDDIAAGGEAETALTTAIARAIEFYSDESFWFTRDTGSVVTTSTSATVVCPYAVRVPKVVSYSGEELSKVPLDTIQHRTETGTPSQWAEEGDLIRLHPIPDGAYSLSVFGSSRLDAPENDADETVWTNEAEDLIAARAKFTLYRDIWRDVEATQLAAQAEGEALSRLRRETRRRSVTPLRSEVARTTYNINTDC